MVDVIANHIGYVDNNDYTSVVPFSSPEHYNKFIDCQTVAADDYHGQETCWLHGLPDLDQNNEFVRKTLLDWIADFVQKYDFDGVRLDALRHVSRTLLARI